MFKKLISNLPFSPGLVGQMGFYIKRLRQEEFIRRMGMIFTALSVAVQMISITVPPTYAQASHANNMVYEAVSSKAHLLKVYDQGDTAGHNDIDEIFNHFGIGRQNIAEATVKTISSASTFDGLELWTMGRYSYFPSLEKAVKIDRTNTTMYLRPWARAWGTHDRQVLLGHRSDGTKFAVIMNCGNLAITFPEKEPEPPEPVYGQFEANCKNIQGWAIDPRLSNKRVKVEIFIDNNKEQSVWAEHADEYIANKSGNHGFKWKIPDGFIDGTARTVSVIAIEDVDARGVSEGDQFLDSNNGKDIIRTDCYEEPPPEQVEICRPGEGLITVDEDKVRPTDFTDKTKCNEIEICVNDDLVMIKQWQYDGEPRTCPQIEVCRDGVVRLITTDQKSDTDLDPEECVEMHVCDPATNMIVTIQKKDYDEGSHKIPEPDDLGTLTCEEPEPEIVRKKQARNLTQDIVYNNTGSAKPGDRIVYELSTANTGNADTSIEITELIDDISEYANLKDYGGAEYDPDKHILSWGMVEVPAGEVLTHTFEVEVKKKLPTTATNPAIPSSFDFIMNNVYGNAVDIKLPKPVSKKVEQFAGNLPNTGPGENAFFITLFIGLVFFFYFRNRLVTKELNMLRKDYRGDA